MTASLERLPTAYAAPPPTARRNADGPAAQVRAYRPDIEGLRALSVLAVVLYHAHLGVRGGFVGVDVFFVISGFLITRQLLGSVGVRGLRALPRFYSRRVRRLLPASATVVVATVLAARIWAPPTQVRSIAVDGLFTTFYGLNDRLAALGTQYLHQADAASPLQHFWSLGVEEQFYLAWPLLIALLSFLGGSFGRRRRGPLVVALLVLIVVSSRWSIRVTAVSAPWAYFSLQTRAWELAVGALIAASASGWARLGSRSAGLLGWSGLGLVVGAALGLSDASPYPGSAAWLPVAGAASVIAAGTGGRRGVERILGEPAMQCIGRVSYSWYLWHWPLLTFAPLVLGRALSVTERLTVVWLSACVAVLSYVLVESPARRLQLSDLRWLGSGVLVSGVVVAAAVVVVVNPPRLTGHGAAVTLAQGSDEVSRAVAAAVDTVAAPRNLTPNPAHAGADVSEAWRAGCHLDFLVLAEKPCVFGDPNGARTLVLFGDSHMDQWEPAFSKAAQQQHWRVVSWTKAACPSAALSVFSTDLHRSYPECDTWRRQTVARIIAMKPDLVVVGESENTKGGGDGSAFAPAEFAGATLTTLRQLRAGTGKRVVFMGDNPVPRVLVPDCVASHLNDVRPCSTDLAHAYTYPDRHKAMRPAVEGAGFTYVDPEPWLCASTGCPAVIGNYLVYRDASHVSRDYVEYLTPMIAPILGSA